MYVWLWDALRCRHQFGSKSIWLMVHGAHKNRVKRNWFKTNSKKECAKICLKWRGRKSERKPLLFKLIVMVLYSSPKFLYIDLFHSSDFCVCDFVFCLDPIPFSYIIIAHRYLNVINPHSADLDKTNILLLIQTRAIHVLQCLQRMQDIASLCSPSLFLWYYCVFLTRYCGWRSMNACQSTILPLRWCKYYWNTTA